MEAWEILRRGWPGGRYRMLFEDARVIHVGRLDVLTMDLADATCIA